jgi:hypothetical protein
MQAKDYRVYDTPEVDWNLNIVGIRTTPASAKKFDDTLVVFHRFLGVWDITYYPITTDPSDHYLRNPINSKGTAILKEGQYKGAYKIAKHNGKYQALCQRNGKVTVYRDKTKDGRLNFTSPDTGMFGINIHKGPKNGTFNTRNSIYSAGCQVFADSRHFFEFMAKCKFGRTAFSNQFTYTLLTEADFD